jgi:hypothetical protein
MTEARCTAPCPFLCRDCLGRTLPGHGIPAAHQRQGLFERRPATCLRSPAPRALPALAYGRLRHEPPARRLRRTNSCSRGRGSRLGTRERHPDGREHSHGASSARAPPNGGTPAPPRQCSSRERAPLRKRPGAVLARSGRGGPDPSAPPARLPPSLPHEGRETPDCAYTRPPNTSEFTILAECAHLGPPAHTATGRDGARRARSA